MVQHTRIEKIDDLDDRNEAVETVTFALRGTEYEIDLSAEHRDDLDDFLRDYIAAARLKRGSRATARGKDNRKISPAVAITALDRTGASAAEVRAWAAANGHELNPMGRIPLAIAEAYTDAQTQAT